MKALEKLDRISAYPLFVNVGSALPTDVEPVTNWQAAANSALSLEWENCRIEARNALWRKIEDRSWERGKSWDDVALETGRAIDAFLIRTLPNTPIPHELATQLKSVVAWDISFICLEAYVQDLVGELFYLPYLDKWYSAGHFPCGWDGDVFPAGWDGVRRHGKLKVL